MPKKQRDLLGVLRLELEFLKSGGYRKPSSWRPQLVFEDSPTCLNYGHPVDTKPCSECVLMQLVPEQLRKEKVPCRHIPLNGQSETIQSLYQSGTPDELESALSEWLMNMIQKLELERIQGQHDRNDLESKKSA